MPPASGRVQEGPVDLVGLDLTLGVVTASEALGFREYLDRGANDTPQSGVYFTCFRGDFTVPRARLRSIASRRVTLRDGIQDAWRSAIEFDHDQRECMTPATPCGDFRARVVIADRAPRHLACACSHQTTL